MAVIGTLGSVASDASACLFGVPTQPREVRCDAPPGDAGTHTTIDDADFTLARLDLLRTVLPSGDFDCGSPGELALEFRWGQAAAWPSDIGLLLTVEAGDFPWIEPSAEDTDLGRGWLLAADGGRVQFFGFDRPHEALDVTIAARAVDCAGALSLPHLVRISDPGLPEPPADGSEIDVEAASGCALLPALEPAGGAGGAPPSTRASVAAPALVGLCIALMAARRAAPRRWRARARGSS